MSSTEKPKFHSNISPKDFSEFYWLKTELIKICKSLALSSSGNKAELKKRISIYLTSGKKTSLKKRTKSKSNFDWHSEKLELNTIITDNYKNTQNVRGFFEEQLGSTFSFNIPFMNWMKKNTGKTLNEAIIYWQKVKRENIKPKRNKELQYNKYIKDFLADNPGKKIKDVIPYWNAKKAKRGHNNYQASDLSLLK